MRSIQLIGMLSGIIMPIFNIPLILRIVRRLELCHSHAAVELAVSGFGLGGIWNRQFALFLRGILHRSLLSSEPQKVDPSRIADGGSSFKPAQSSATAKFEHPGGLYRVS
jgi:hypothetical protein